MGFKTERALLRSTSFLSQNWDEKECFPLFFEKKLLEKKMGLCEVLLSFTISLFKLLYTLRLLSLESQKSEITLCTEITQKRDVPIFISSGFENLFMYINFWQRLLSIKSGASSEKDYLPSWIMGLISLWSHFIVRLSFVFNVQSIHVPSNFLTASLTKALVNEETLEIFFFPPDSILDLAPRSSPREPSSVLISGYSSPTPSGAISR